MNKNELIFNTPVSIENTQFNAKFDFLYAKVMKSHMKEISNFNLIEKAIHYNFSNLNSNLNKKAESTCGKQIEKINLYSTQFEENLKNLDEFSSVENLKNLRITPGNEKEFNLAFNDLVQCSNKFFTISQEIKNKFQSMGDLAKSTNDLCLEECKRGITEFRQTENEAVQCIESCWRYKKYNLEACIEITENEIRDKEKMIIHM